MKRMEKLLSDARWALATQAETYREVRGYSPTGQELWRLVKRLDRAIKNLRAPSPAPETTKTGGES